ncbi:MAG: dTDP-glucose 4,6-dehydratase [Candidatus Omnitrophica bacterium]|nr:dTDP-glucose 4,6-dehydratase [Candidatus Omnitrophota bacterium]
MRIVVTGGAGFIGSEFVRQLAKRGLSPHSYNVSGLEGDCPRLIVIDKLTYAGDLKRLDEVKGKFKFYKVDICDKNKICAVFQKEKPDIVVNFSAETHVDRSIVDSSSFINTNINGTKVLLDACLKYQINKFIHISSDEVYGEIEKGVFNEDSPLQPNSPYSASKAAADLLIRSYIRTYGLPAIIVRPSNNYGPWQYPEKFIPVAIHSVLKGGKIPVYGRGLNVREWLYVSSCVEGIILILKKGKPGGIYNLGSGFRKRNIDLAMAILNKMDKPHRLIKFVRDRPGHDLRYSLDSSKAQRLGWKPGIGLNEGLQKTIDWYKESLSWLNSKI